MKVIKYIFLIIWTLGCFVGVLKNASHYGFVDWIIILIFILFPYIIIKIISSKKAIKNRTEKNSDIFDSKETITESIITQTAENELPTAYIETENVIYRADENTISDDEVPYLIQAGYEKAISEEQNNKNPKFHRTEREENLSFNFITKYGTQVDTLTENFESAYRNSFNPSDIDEKISLLNEAKKAFEKAKKFCYSKGKGGTIYFQDMWEYMHNSQNECFSYLNNIDDSLEECIFQRDVAIPKIIDIITHTPGILQKDIYKLLPDVDRSTVQRTIKYLESKNKISSEKKKNSYELHINE